MRMIIFRVVALGVFSTLVFVLCAGRHNNSMEVENLVGLRRPAPVTPADSDASCDLSAGECDIAVTQPAETRPESTSAKGRPDSIAPPQKNCTYQDKEIPCTSSQLPGSWWNRWDECYYAPMDIYDPFWGSPSDYVESYSYYEMICPRFPDPDVRKFMMNPEGRYISGFTSFDNPEESNPPADHPYGLAITASKRMKFPQPQVEFLRHAEYINNNPLVLVNAPMWWWATDAAQWKPLEQTARAGEVWARLSATPQGWTFNPGNGDSEVSCNGPGEQWKPGGGFWAKSPTGCSYTYKYTSIDQQDQKMTGTFSRTWRLNWVASDGTRGTLPVMHTSVTHRFRVGEAQTLVTQ